MVKGLKIQGTHLRGEILYVVWGCDKCQYVKVEKMPVFGLKKMEKNRMGGCLC